MSYNKFIFFCAFLTLILSTRYIVAQNKNCPNYFSNEIGADFAFNTIKKLVEIANNGCLENVGKNIGQTVVKEIVNSGCLENAGKNLGLGTLVFVGGKIAQAGTGVAAGVASGGAKILACGKAAGTVIVSAPAAPYVLVGAGVVVVGYGVYRTYRYYNPTTGEIIEKTIEIARLDEAKARALKAKTELFKAQTDYDATVLEATAKRMMEQNMAATAAA